MARWTDHLSPAVYNRLCNCCNSREDLKELVDAKWMNYVERGKHLEGYTKEDAVVDILDWLDSNGQYIDLTSEEFKELSAE